MNTTDFSTVFSTGLHRLLMLPCPLCWTERKTLQYPGVLAMSHRTTLLCDGYGKHTKIHLDAKSTAEVVAVWNTIGSVKAEFPIRAEFPFPAAAESVEAAAEALLRRWRQKELTSKMMVEAEIVNLRRFAERAQADKFHRSIPIIYDGMLITGYQRRPFCHTSIDLSHQLRPVSLAISRFGFEGSDPSLHTLKHCSWGTYELLFASDRAYTTYVCGLTEIGTLVQLRALGLSWATIEEALARPLRGLAVEEETWQCYKQFCSFLEVNPHLVKSYATRDPKHWLDLVVEFEPKSYELWKTYKVLRDLCDDLDRKSNEALGHHEAPGKFVCKGTTTGRVSTKAENQSAAPATKETKADLSPTGRAPSQPEFQDLPKVKNLRDNEGRKLTRETEFMESYRKAVEKFNKSTEQNLLKPILKINDVLAELPNSGEWQDMYSPIEKHKMLTEGRLGKGGSVESPMSCTSSAHKVDLAGHLEKLAKDAGIPVVLPSHHSPKLEADFKMSLEEWWDYLKSVGAWPKGWQVKQTNGGSGEKK